MSKEFLTDCQTFLRFYRFCNFSQNLFLFFAKNDKNKCAKMKKIKKCLEKNEKSHSDHNALKTQSDNCALRPTAFSRKRALRICKFMSKNLLTRIGMLCKFLMKITLAKPLMQPSKTFVKYLQIMSKEFLTDCQTFFKILQI